MSAPAPASRAAEKQPAVTFYAPPIALSPSSPPIGPSASGNRTNRSFAKSPRWLGPGSQQPIHHVLPDEVMQQIFSYLRPRWLGRATRVCKEWHNLASDNTFLKQMTAFYNRVVKDNTAERPNFIMACPGGNLAELFKAPTTTVEAYKKAGKNYSRKVKEHQEVKQYQSARFSAQRREHQETFPKDVMLERVERREENQKCCSGCSACGLTCTIQ